MARFKDQGKGEPSVRLLRVGENVRHAIADVLARGELHDETLSHSPITVTEARVSPDLRNATVFVMPLGGDPDNSVTKALNEQSAQIRGLISPRLTMKYMPRLKFKLDESFDTATHIDHLLKDPRVKQDIEDDSGTTHEE